jgi:hypothetical protein
MAKNRGASLKDIQPGGAAGDDRDLAPSQRAAPGIPHAHREALAQRLAAAQLDPEPTCSSGG